MDATHTITIGQLDRQLRRVSSRILGTKSDAMDSASVDDDDVYLVVDERDGDEWGESAYCGHRIVDPCAAYAHLLTLPTPDRDDPVRCWSRDPGQYTGRLLAIFDELADWITTV